MVTHKIKINSNDEKILGTNLTQQELVRKLKMKLHHDLFIATEIKFNNSNTTVITFVEKGEQGETTNLEIRIDEKKCHKNENVKALKQLAKKCKNHTTYVDPNLIIRKTLKLAVGVTVAAGITTAVFSMGSYIGKKIIEEDNERFSQKQEQIADLYKGENDVDVRTYPTVGDNGYWLDEHYYITEEGIKWFCSNEGKWFEMGTVVKNNMTAEELENSYEAEEHHKGY